MCRLPVLIRRAVRAPPLLPVLIRQLGDLLECRSGEPPDRFRNRLEGPCSWMKQIGGLRKVKLRGLAKVEWLFVFTCAAYNLLRIPKLRAECA